jgi:thiazole synthase ThiGH ThiG subunit
VISVRLYKQQLDETLMSPAARRAAEAWVKQAEDHGKRQLVLRRTIAADRLKDAMAEAVNASQLAHAITTAVRAGKLAPAEGIQQLRDLGDIVERADAELPDVQKQLAAANAADPLEAFGTFIRTFPAMEMRIGPPPPLTA